MKDNSRPIGVFDSGIGGISVLKEIVSLMPEENYIYYGEERIIHIVVSAVLVVSDGNQ